MPRDQSREAEVTLATPSFRPRNDVWQIMLENMQLQLEQYL
jgi:hypothetical protein